MANLMVALREEIARLARKEIKADLDALRKSSSNYRSEIAALKRRVAVLESQLKKTTKVAAKVAAANAEADAESGEKTKFRFRQDGFVTLRKKLGISADAMGKLIGVSGQSIYLWESGRSTPRASNLPAIAELRHLGKKEVAARLEALGAEEAQ